MTTRLELSAGIHWTAEIGDSCPQMLMQIVKDYTRHEGLFGIAERSEELFFPGLGLPSAAGIVWALFWKVERDRRGNITFIVDSFLDTISTATSCR